MLLSLRGGLGGCLRAWFNCDPSIAHLAINLNVPDCHGGPPALRLLTKRRGEMPLGNRSLRENGHFPRHLVQRDFPMASYRAFRSSHDSQIRAKRRCFPRRSSFTWPIQGPSQLELPFNRVKCPEGEREVQSPSFWPLRSREIL